MAITPTKTLKNTIKTMLNTLTGAGQKIQYVYGYFEPLPQQFPCAMVDIYKGGRDDIYTNSDNMVLRRFFIHVQILGKNTEQNTELRMDIMDDIIAVLNSATYGYSLNNGCDILTIDSIEPFNDDSSESPKIGFDVILSCKSVDALD